MLSATQKVLPIAFYLPQYHPIVENDSWWGKGFTEWTNVARAQPLFPGHYQPHLPADLGFYDLRLAEARQEQATLAKAHGIHGFCYYHYWFHGQRLLERPFNEVLKTRQPDFPFCLCWANETWSRRWLGEERNILIKQTYSKEDDCNHIRWLVDAFSDPRYIRIGERPLFLIYRPHDLPNPKETADIFRQECAKIGLSEPYLVGVDAHQAGFDYRQIGFDETLRFEPQLSVLSGFLDDKVTFSKLLNNAKLGIMNPKLKVYDYTLARHLMSQVRGDFPVIPSIFVSWDNTARRGENGVVMINSTPENFEAGLSEVVDFVRNKPLGERFIFINAWNEWAEGNHLEPDQKHGTEYLQAVKRVVLNQEIVSVGS
jgi:lipopolysaccharide biosynthesis protein